MSLPHPVSYFEFTLTTCHRLSGLDTIKMGFSMFWRLKVQGQEVQGGALKGFSALSDSWFLGVFPPGERGLGELRVLS